jgi:hypothetical protein
MKKRLYLLFVGITTVALQNHKFVLGQDESENGARFQAKVLEFLQQKVQS